MAVWKSVEYFMPKIDELKERYRVLYGNEGVGESTLSEIEAALGLTLPQDFKEIARFFRGGFLGGKSHHAIDISGPANNIVGETLRLRNAIGLPTKFVVIAEPAESLIVMETGAESSNIIWCDAFDAKNLADAAGLRNPQVWPSYSVFFEYLVNEEEDERESKD
jgi:hypothetical protein